MRYDCRLKKNSTSAELSTFNADYLCFFKLMFNFEYNFT